MQGMDTRKCNGHTPDAGRTKRVEGQNGHVDHIKAIPDH